MKTEFSKFCQDFAAVLQPLRGILQESVEYLREKPDADTLTPTLSGLTDLNHRLKTLLDKVEAQHAYVIVFGPLKSGKSTLMNAISSAYVSEVSSMPAYPCLVYVRHGDELGIVVTKYNGKVEEYDNSDRMQDVIVEQHAELADRIRMTEEQGEVFDPGSHYTDAIRRIDIALPAETLKSSYTVLVDTPGLYSRMRFGYDLMTKEFRDSAACAVFVVKTDNLFLEQVFEEFNDLLDLFSRIFLVVNIDTNKRDLGSDGKLHPSLESRDPDKIIEAFRSLSMSAPLRRAFDAGRLKIYPIDLLNSAAASLQGRLGSDSGHSPMADEVGAASTSTDIDSKSDLVTGPGDLATDEIVASASGIGSATVVDEDDSASGSSAVPPPAVSSSDTDADQAETDSDVFDDSADADTAVVAEVTVERAAARGGASFEEFLSDLTDYLNSSDYLINFMRDSLRQGHTLISELRGHASNGNLSEFRSRLDQLEGEQRSQQKRRDAISQLDEVDWIQAFARSRDQCRSDGEKFATVEQQRLQSELSGEIVQWFNRDDSLADLLDERVRPRVQACLGRIREDAEKRVQRLTEGNRCGAELNQAQNAALGVAGLSLAQIQDSEGISPGRIDDTALRFDDSLSIDALQVRKTIWDWILFRTLAKIRIQTFGAGERPDNPIPVKVKHSRLRDGGKQALEAEITTMLGRAFPEIPRRLSTQLLDHYAKSFDAAIGTRLDQAREELDRSLPLLKEHIGSAHEILKTLDNLIKDAAKFDDGIDQLEQDLSKTHPEIMIAGDGVLEFPAESSAYEDDYDSGDEASSVGADSGEKSIIASADGVSEPAGPMIDSKADGSSDQPVDDS